jgi:hypothetical protein
MKTAAKTNINGIVENVILVEDFIPDGYQLCNPWIGIGMNINDPEPVIVTPPPTSVTMRQARLALHRAGLLAQVNAAVAGNPEAEIEWEYATTVDRTGTLTQTLAAGLGLTAQQLDELFITAAQL